MGQGSRFRSPSHHTRIRCNGAGRTWEKRRCPKQELEDQKDFREEQRTGRLQRWWKWSKVREVVGKPTESFDSYTVETPGLHTRLYNHYFTHCICNILCLRIHITSTFIVTVVLLTEFKTKIFKCRCITDSKKLFYFTCD